MTPEERQAAQAFWKLRTRSAPSVALWGREDAPRCEAARLRHPLPRPVHERLRALSRGDPVLMWAVVFAAFAIVVERHTKVRDLLVATAPFQGYPSGGDLLVVRIDISASETVGELLGAIRRELREVLPRQQVAVEASIEPRDARRVRELGFHHASAQGAEFRAGEDIALNVLAREAGDTTVLEAWFNGLAFDASTVREGLAQVSYALRALMEARDAPWATLEVLPPEQRESLAALTDAPRTWPVGSLWDALHATLQSHPDLPAARYGGDTLSYADIDAASGALAGLLRSELSIGDTVAVCLPRSPWTLIALLALFRSGLVYVPIDERSPRARIAEIVRDAGARRLLTSRTLDTPEEVERVFLETGTYTLPPVSPFPSHAPRPDDCAYIIYTSGSTGRPKGIAQTHRTLNNLIRWQDEALGGLRGLRYLQFCSAGFDVSLEDLLYTVFSAGCCCFPPEEARIDPRVLTRYARRERIQATFLPTSVFHDWVCHVDTPLPELVHLLVGGEHLVLSGEVRQFLYAHPRLQLRNIYGPSENHVVTCARVEADDALVTVGRPIPNTEILVVDQHGRLCPRGVAGELWIGGDGLFRGYVNRPERTAATRVPHPFRPGRYVFRSGDRGRWLPGGEIALEGRADNQLKIRGNLVVLDEVTESVRALPGISRALVLAEEGRSGRRLVAHVVAAPSVEAAALRRALLQRLPEYMVPSRFVVHERFPLTMSGKLDGSVLAQSGRPLVSRAEPGASPLAPMFAEALELSHCGDDADFFEHGGSSVVAIDLIARINDRFGTTLTVVDLFEHPSPRALAARLPEHPAPAAPRREAERPALPPASFAQRRMWFVNDVYDGAEAWHVPAAFRLRGALDAHALREALQAVVHRHSALHTGLQVVEGALVQVRDHAARIPWSEVDLSAHSAPLDAALAQAGVLARMPFDLDEAPLLRAALYRLAPDDAVLVLCLHHAACDGASMAVLTRELPALYADPAGLPPPRWQYTDFATEEQTMEWPNAEAHWAAVFAVPVEPLQLPVDAPRPPLRTLRGRDTTAELGEWHGLEPLCVAHRATLFMGLTAVVVLLLARITGQDDIVVGVPILGRDEARWQDTVGFFVNTVPLRIRLSEHDTFATLLARVRDVATEAYRHQTYPFEELARRHAGPRDLSRSPLFDVMVAHHDVAHALTLDLPGVHAERLPLGLHTSQYDVAFNFLAGSPLRCVLESNALLFHPDTIEVWLRSLDTLLAHAIRCPDTPLCQLDAVHPRDRVRLEDLNPPAPVAPAPLSNRLRAHPAEHIALVHGSTRLDYGTLRARAERLIPEIAALPPGPVALSMPRGIDRIVWVVACLLTGRTFLPLDPDLPVLRVETILSRAGAAAHVSRELRVLRGRTDEDEAAYVIFTSGSTGDPVGVRVGAPGLATMTEAWRLAYGITPEDRILQVAPVGFDVFIGDVCRALGTGATLVLADPDDALDPPALVQRCRTQGITMLEVTPAVALGMLAWLEQQPAPLPALRLLIVGSDVLSSSDYQRLREGFGVRVLNSYGTTEATIDSTFFEAPAGPPPEPLPIGTPLPGVQAWVLDSRQSLVPPGVAGELCIGGKTVALGYVDGALEADRFVQTRYGRLFRTGDRARWDPSRQLCFLGRSDAQVKVRGFRVSLVELEATCAEVPGITRAVAWVDGGSLRVGFVGEASCAALERHCRERLPDFAVPSLFVQLDDIPLTPHGKVDRRPLARRAQLEPTGGSPLQGPSEHLLATVWSEVLDREIIDARAHFFRSGGDSLAALRVISALYAHGVRLTVRDVFLNPELRDLARVLETP